MVNFIKKLICVPFILLSITIIAMCSGPIIIIKMIKANIPHLFISQYKVNALPTIKTTFQMTWLWISDLLWRD